MDHTAGLIVLLDFDVNAPEAERAAELIKGVKGVIAVFTTTQGGLELYAKRRAELELQQPVPM